MPNGGFWPQGKQVSNFSNSIPFTTLYSVCSTVVSRTSSRDAASLHIMECFSSRFDAELCDWEHCSCLLVSCHGRWG